MRDPSYRARRWLTSFDLHAGFHRVDVVTIDGKPLVNHRASKPLRSWLKENAKGRWRVCTHKFPHGTSLTVDIKENDDFAAFEARWAADMREHEVTADGYADDIPFDFFLDRTSEGEAWTKENVSALRDWIKANFVGQYRVAPDGGRWGKHRGRVQVEALHPRDAILFEDTWWAEIEASDENDQLDFNEEMDERLYGERSDEDDI